MSEFERSRPVALYVKLKIFSLVQAFVHRAYDMNVQEEYGPDSTCGTQTTKIVLHSTIRGMTMRWKVQSG